MSAPSVVDTLLPRPYGKTLLVYVPPTAGEMQVGSIVVLASATEEPLVGNVIAVGDIPDIRKGSRVGFSKYAGTTFSIAGLEYHVLQQSDVQLVWDAEINERDAIAAVGRSAAGLALA